MHSKKSLKQRKEDCCGIKFALHSLFYFIAFSMLYRLSDAVTLRDFCCASAEFVMTCAVSWSVIDFNRSHIHGLTHISFFYIYIFFFVASIVLFYYIVFQF